MSNPNIRAAAVAWLRMDPVVASAFGDTTANPGTAPAVSKFWADYAGPMENGESPEFPYLVMVGRASEDSYESIAGDGTQGEVIDGILECSIFDGSKTSADNLAELVADSLRDADLVFDEGGLLLFRRTYREFPPITEVGPAGSPAAADRVVRFRFLIERDFPARRR